MKSSIFYIAWIFFAACLTVYPSELGNSRKDLEFQEVISLVAKGILDPECIIVVGECRMDYPFRLDDNRDRRKVSEVITTLFLNPLFPLTILRGNLSQEIIWVENVIMDLRGAGRRYHLPSLGREGVWLCFLRPVSELPLNMLGTPSDLNAKIRNFDKSTHPHQLVEQLAVDSWLNEQTWFALHQYYSVFSIDLPVRDLELPVHIGDITRQSFAELRSRHFEVLESTPLFNHEFKLNAEDLSEITKLVKMFNSPETVPTPNELVGMKSIFADAILRELTVAAESELSESLLQLKSDIPASVRERIREIPISR